MISNIEYQLSFSKRRSVALQITDDAELRVRAPFKTPQKVIEDFIIKKMKWIEKHLNRAREHKDRILQIRQNSYPVSYYKKQAKHLIPVRVKALSALTGFAHKGIKLTSGRKRFGSCSSKDCLTFSWRLLLAPENVLDYVIIHELAHTVEKNHSKKFWDKIEVLMPGYKTAHTWLRDNGAALNI